MVAIRKNGTWIYEPDDDPVRDCRKCVADVTKIIVDSISKLKEIEKFNSSDSFRDQFREISNQYYKVVEKMESLMVDLKDYDNRLYELELILRKYLSEPTML